jgi:hypothetical protein
VYLTEAVSAYREALQEFTRTRVPFRWVMAQMTLATVYCALFDKDAQPNHLDDALAAVEGALEEYRKAKAGYYIERAGRQRGKILAKKDKL